MRRVMLVVSCAVLFLEGCRMWPGKPEVETTSVAPPPQAEAAPAPQLMDFTATAYSVEGRTAKKTKAREGVVAADPKVLPLGTRIRVHDAGHYSGEYRVEDTGRKISGREIDIYISKDSEAKRFGKKPVKVEILEKGNGGPS